MPAATANQQAGQQRWAAPRDAAVLAPVRGQLRQVLLIGRPGDVAGPAVLEQHLPVLHTPAGLLAGRTAARPDRTAPPPAECIGAGIGRVDQQADHRRPLGPVPCHLATHGAGTLAVRQGNAVVGQVAHDAVDAAPALEHVEHELDGVAHALVRVLGDLAGQRPHVAPRQVEAQLAALGLVPPPGIEPGAHDVQLGLAHCAFEAEQQPIVVERGIVDAVAVGDEGAGQRADFQQVIPVAA